VGRGCGLPLYSRTDSCSSLVGRTVRSGSKLVDWAPTGST
jgi:hypothetical protein